MAARLFVWFTIGNGKNLNAAKFSLPISNITVLVQLHKNADASVMLWDIAAPHKDRNKSNRIESNLLCLRPCRLCLLHASPAYLCCPRRTILHPESSGPPF